MVHAIETQTHAIKRRFWLYAPVAISIALIFWASTERFAWEHTAQVIHPWISWISPGMNPQTLEWLHFAIRKSAHVTEYAIFALLAARMTLGSFSGLPPRDWFLVCFLLLATLAVTDEYHQSFVPSRTAAVTDVLIDLTGGLVALLTLALWRRWSVRPSRLNHGLGSAGSVAPTSSWK